MEQMIRSAELEHRPASLQFSNMSNDEQNSDQKLLIIGTYQLSSEMGSKCKLRFNFDKIILIFL